MFFLPVIFRVVRCGLLAAASGDDVDGMPAK